MKGRKLSKHLSCPNNTGVGKSNILDCQSHGISCSSAPEDQRPQVEDACKLQKETPKEPGPKIDDHEPRLGPRPRSHNKVLNPPGGKSSIAFY